jgi:ABC-type iron transport system FetAB ATPase subunit
VDKVIFLYKALALCEQDFVTTESFRKVVNAGDKKILIAGPTGVGKSMAQAAIETLYCGKRPCYVWSSRTILDQELLNSYV